MNQEWNSNSLEDDRLERRRKRRKRNHFMAAAVVVFGSVLVLVLITVIAGIIYMRINPKNQGDTEEQAVSATEVKNSETITYTQQELDAKLEEAVREAESRAVESTTKEILEGIKQALSEGDTMVEALRPFYSDELVVVSEGKIHFIPIQDNLKKNNYLNEKLNILESGEYQYVENGQVTSHKGIDVSKFQGDIDWQKVAADGVEFAFIRVGNRGYGSGKLVEDETFEENIEGALSAGIKVGVYFYTQAINEEEVLEEANLVLEKIAPYKIECPIVFDVEKVSGDTGRMNVISVEERTNLTLLFCQTIENAGYKPMIYHNMEMGALMLDLETLENYDKWFAYYNPEFYYPYDYKIWQYTHQGTVDGIKGDVDVNISFTPFWEE